MSTGVCSFDPLAGFMDIKDFVMLHWIAQGVDNDA